MSETLFPTFRKIAQTPIRDLLRLRLTGRQDWKSQLATSGLPVPVADLISDVVKRTRLWRLEKASVAQELIAHFLDGQAGNASTDELLKRFGDPKLAARLIRRSKKRGRPMLWHMWIASLRMGAIVLGIYGIFVIRFFVSKPTLSVDYVAKLNAPIFQTTPDHRAWPLWRKAIIAASDGRNVDGDRVFANAVCKVGRQSKEVSWKDRVDWLNHHTAAIEAARKAGLKPEMGFVLGGDGSVNDPELFRQFPAQQKSAPLILVLVPHLNYLRIMGDMLSLDAKLAVENNNVDQFEKDFMAMLGLSKQLRTTDGFLNTQLFGLHIDRLAIERLQQALVGHPAMFSDEQLMRLGCSIAGPQVAADLISIGSERYFFADIAQRIFSDDGHGDGHITADGLKFFVQTYFQFSQTGHDADDIALAVASTVPMGIASRSEQVAMYNQFVDLNEANFQRPVRSVDLQEIVTKIVALHNSVTNAVRYAPALQIVSSVGRVQEWCEVLLGERDGAAMAIALELFHRRHSEYPATMAELTPELLPGIPLDRVTGDPVKYRLIDGKPVVYSVGVDRIDDGGKRIDKTSYYPSDIEVMWEKTTIVQKMQGDWVLYPPDPTDDGN